jgi:hypothetical protein
VMAGARCGACRGWTTTTAVMVASAAVGISVAACSGGSGTPSASSSATASALPGDRHGVGGEQPHGIIGQISAENGSTWTVTARDGTRYSVIITPETHFGSPQAPSSVQQFPVGTAVRVTGTITDHTITALLISAPGSRHLGSTAPTASTAPTG